MKNGVRMMNKPTTAMIDGDIIAWKAAFVAETEGVMSIGSLVSGLMEKWTPKGCDKSIVALSCPKADNFRRDVYPGYKENRDNTYKPEFLKDVFDHISENYEVMVLPKLEADDVLGIYASSGDAIAITIDKDLRGVMGWHYNPDKEEEPVFVDAESAERWFCIQWMAGDSTDGIPGLWRIGKKKASKFLDEWEKDEWYDQIRELYTEGKHVPENKHEVDDFCEAMGQCVRILSHDNYDKDTDKITMWTLKMGYKNKEI
jgi:DNA polymerase-1